LGNNETSQQYYLFLLAAGYLVNMFVWSAVVSKKKKQLAPFTVATPNAVMTIEDVTKKALHYFFKV
jgi:hypothetical protein